MSQSLPRGNSQQTVQVSHDDFPLCCPPKDNRLWDSHPRVYLPLEDVAEGEILCPYCGTRYILDAK